MSALWSRRGLGDPGDRLIPARPPAMGGVRTPSPEEAMRQSAVWACVMLRASLIASFDLNVYRRIGERETEQLPQPAVFLSPAGEQWDMGDWLLASQIDLELRGNTFGRIVDRDPRTQLPTQIELAPVDTVRPPTSSTPQWRFGSQEVPAVDVWHERTYPVPGRLLGLSPIAYHAATVGVALSAQKFGADWFASGAHPSAVLSHVGQPVEQGAARVVKERFMASVRNREPIVMGGDWKYQAVQVAPNESQFLETMKYTGSDICRIFNMPADVVDLPSGGTSLTYSNREQRNLDLLAMRIGPTLKRRERVLSRRLLPRGQWCRFDTSDLTRADTATRTKTNQTAITAGLRVPSELRLADGLPPFTDEQWLELFKLYEAQKLTVKATETVEGVV